MRSSRTDWEQEEIQAAAREAAAIGGHAGDESLDPALCPLIEAGEGVAEGFELAEEDLIEAAETRDGWADPGLHAFAPEAEADRADIAYGEANHEDSSELVETDR